MHITTHQHFEADYRADGGKNMLIPTIMEEYALRGDQRPVLGICPWCNKAVHGEDDLYEADEAYMIDGWTVHEDCVFPFLRKRGYKI